MARKIVALTMCLILIMLSLDGCFGRQKADESFAVPILDEPTSLDPQIADSDAEKMIILNCWEGLMRVNSKGELESGVAESYDVSSDGLTYTFNLRQDAHWALFSGHKNVLGDDYKDTFDITVYAEDFEFAFSRIFDDTIGSPYKSIFSCIESFEASGKFTFTVKLKYRYDGFLYALTLPGAMPCDKEFYEKTGGKYGLDAKYMLSNGAFNASRWSEGSSIRIVRNDDYNGVNRIMPSAVTFYINSSQSAVAEKMGTGTYDMAFLTADGYNALPNKEDYNAQALENTVYSLIFNQSDKYLENRNIRLAIVHSIGHELSEGLSEGATAATGFVPPFCTVGNEKYASSASVLPSFDEALARECFEQGLLEIGSSSVELEIKCTQRYEQFIKQIVQIMQKTLGVRFVITVNTLEMSDINAAISDGDYSIVFYPFVAESARTDEFLESFEDNSLFNYSSEEYSAALDEIRASLGDFAALRKSCEKAEGILISDAVMLPVLFDSSYFITDADSAGIYFYNAVSNVVFMSATRK